jgi:penicillin amidase
MWSIVPVKVRKSMGLNCEFVDRPAGTMGRRRGVFLIQRRAFLLASVAALAMPARLAAQAADRSGLTLKGARAPIEIVEDRLGIPHVRAGSLHDAFFGQGYLVARDRLFQIDQQYRREQGRMAEAFGPGFVAADTAARLFHYRGDIDAELAAMPPGVLEAAQGYVAGVNARIAELAADPAQLPLEYPLLGITPLSWDLRALARARGVETGDAEDEIRRARLAAVGELEADRLMSPLRPAWTFKLPDGLDVAAVTDADLGLLAPAARPLPFAALEQAGLDPEQRHADRFAQGSNAWTIAASRSATGRPILANDPHLGIGSFSPRHMVHLTAPGLDVIGAGAPGLPGIMQGHTDRFAFGRTNSHIDQTDLFILKTAEADPELYWHKGQWKRFETHEEVIAVKGAAPQRVQLRYSAGRPIVSHDPTKQRAVAFATADMLPGALMRFAIIAINLATDWPSLMQAFKLHVSPTNFHYADTSGNTRWQIIGFAPRRPRHDGLLPAPGDGSHDWTGLIPVAELPGLHNPAEGWFASANQLNVPADYPHARKIIGFEWSDPFRHDRICEVLKAQPQHRIEDSIALQHDIQSPAARMLVKLIPASVSPAAAPAAALLRGWNGALHVDSAAALLYHMVMPELLGNYRLAMVPEAAQPLIPSVNLHDMLQALATPDKRMARDAMIDKALAAGWQKALDKGGADPARWRWGDLHRVTITHPLASLPRIAAAFPAIEGGRSGGDGQTPMARGLNVKRGYGVTHGASYLQVIDVGGWDNSRFLLLPGQSADPRSPQFKDFYDRWIAGDMQPLWFSRAAVEANAARRLAISPG